MEIAKLQGHIDQLVLVSTWVAPQSGDPWPLLERRLSPKSDISVQRLGRSLPVLEHPTK